MRDLLTSISKLMRAKNEPCRRRRSVRLTFEYLEDRCVPSQSPVLVSPSGSVSTNPTFTWVSVTGATTYDFSLTDQTTGSAVINQSNITSTSFHLPTGTFPLAQTDTYQWTARADSGGVPLGPYSTPLAFTPDAALQNPNWSTRFGSYTFSNGNTTAVGHSSQNTAVLNGVNLSDVSVSASVAFTATNQNAGLVARYIGSGDANMYVGRLVYLGSNAVSAAIYRNVGGVWTQIGTTKNVSGASGTLVFETLGSELKLFFNNNLVSYAYDSSFTTGTVGVRSSEAVVLSTFQASANSPVLATLPFSDSFTSPSFGNQLSNSWQERVGNFNIGSTTAIPQNSTVALATVNGITSGDVNVQGNFQFTAANQYVGLVARYSGTGDNNMYYGRLLYLGSNVANAAIFRNLNGTWTQIGGSLNLNVTSGLLTFQVVGTQLKLFLNGNILVSGVDGTFTAGASGMRTFGTGLSSFQLSSATNTSNWIIQSGAINVALGTAFTDPGSGGIATYMGSNSADVTVQGNVSFNATSQYAGLVARYSGAGDNNMYFGRLLNLGGGMVNAAIFRNLNGAWTQIGVAMNVASTGGALTFQVEGTSLKLFLNGVLVAYGNDTALSSGTVGIRAFGGSTVDSFQFAPPTIITNTLPFTDNFSAPSQGNQLSYSWEEQGGNFNLSTGAAVGQSSTNFATVNGINAVNTTVVANVNLTAAGQYAGLVARYSNPQSPNMYYASLTRQSNGQYTAAIYRDLHGSWTLLASTTIATFNNTLQFNVSGSSLSLFVDGVQRLSTTDGIITVGGLVGMRGSQGAAYNSFSAS